MRTEGIEKAYADYHPMVYVYIYNRIGQKEEAEDLAQDVFVRLLEYEQTILPDTLRYFVFTIARNLVFDYLRRHYKRQEISSYLYDHTATCSNETESLLVANDLEACERQKLTLLPPQRQKVYTLSRFDELSVQDISEELHLSTRTVENHLFLSRKEIRQYLSQCI